MKPWARYEVGFINHDKFRAITANAICLWLEGKNYADAKLTDGLLPDYEVKHWRFHSKKSVALLTRSCGTKPGTDQPYAPLWDVVEGFGYKMHDYLAHNDTRDIALERIAKADAAKEKNAQRKAAWRAAKDAKEAARLPDSPPADVPADVPRDNGDNVPHVPALSRSIQKAEDRIQNQKKQEQQSGGGSRRPIFTGQRITVFEWFLEKAERILGETHYLAFDIHEWFYALDAQAVAANAVIPDRDNGEWLAAQLVAEARRRGLPMVVATTETPTLGKLSSRMAAMVANARAEGM